MKIQFINKNNNRWYDIEPGVTITDNYNETLDSAILTITHLDAKIDGKIDIEPFDRVILDNNGVYRYMCVDTYSCNQISFSDPIYYNYQISLFSETKLLEGIILPSLKITQLHGDYKRKIYSDDLNDIKKFGYLDEYLKRYGKKVRKQSGDQVLFTDAWHFSQRVIDRFSKIECPEMQWNQPTLRQVLNDLMMIDDCIVVLRNNEIDYIDISEQGSEISKNGISQVQESQSSQDYVNELRVELKNVMQSEIEGVNNVVTATEYIGFRNSDGYKVDETNFRIETKNPILDLVEVQMTHIMESTGSDAYIYEVLDLTPYIVEYKKWILLPVFYGTLGDATPEGSSGEYQQNTLYFNRGGNTIDGMYNTSRTDLVTTNALLKIMRDIQLKNGFVNYISPALDRNPTSINNLKNCCFVVKYKTTASSLMQVGKNKNFNERVVVDNQTNSYVDSYAQGLLEYMKVNRLGNTMKIIDARYGYEDTIPELSQTFDGSVIFQRKLTYWDNYIVANFYATEGYVLRDYFTGVQAKIRSWKIVDGSEALERHDLIKYYLEFSYSNVNEVSIGTFLNKSLENYLLNEFITDEVKLMKYGAVNFKGYDISNRYPAETKTEVRYYLIDIVSRISGNSLLFTFGFDDNYYVGKYIDLDINITELGGLAEVPCGYVDEDGENIGGSIMLTNYHSRNAFPTMEFLEEQTQSEFVGDEMQVFIFEGGQTYQDEISALQSIKPIANGSEFVGTDVTSIEFPFFFHKDNSEITRITTQFEFCSDTEDIVFGSQFLKNLQAIRTAELDVARFKLYGSNKKPSFRNKDFLPDDKQVVNELVLDVSDNKLTVNYEINNYNYLYLTDKNDKVILAFRRIGIIGTTSTAIYLNLLRSRDKNIYDDDGYIVNTL